MSRAEEYRPWFEKYPKLYKKQIDILKSAGFVLNQEVFDREGRLQFVGNSKVEPERKLIVEFPAAFPSSAPKVFDTDSSGLLARHHRADSRQLCLFGFNGVRWSAACSVDAALTEAEALISKFKDGDAVSEIEPPEPLTGTLKYMPETAFLVPPPIASFDHFDQLKYATGKFRGKFVYEGDPKKTTVGRGLVFEAEFGESKVKCDRLFSEMFGKNGNEVYGNWFYEQGPVTQQNIVDILRKCFQLAKAVKRADFYWIALIFREEMGSAGQLQLTWLMARANAAGQLHLIRTFPYKQDQRFVRIPGLEGLEQKRVTLVGCGSIGSKIAANLAASGVSSFCLVDFDFFEPNNSVRHELGVDSFGIGKARGLASRLCSLNPAAGTNSQFVQFQVAGTNVLEHEKSFFKMAQSSDLIIDATAVHAVSRFINELSFQLGIPAVFASVTNGAWAGEIVRVLPAKTPCWLCWLDQYFDIKPPTAPEAAAKIFAQGCDQPTFTGTTYELGMVANLATSIAVDTLLNRWPLSNNYIRWSGRDKDGRAVFLTEMLMTSPRKECFLCGSLYGI